MTVIPRHRRAVHEAAHARAVVLFGGRVLSATIVPDDNYMGRVCWTGDLTPMNRAVVAVVGVIAEQRTYRTAHRRLVAARRLSSGAVSDVERLLDLTRDYGLDYDDMWRWGQVFVDMFLSDIGRLATALYDAGELDEEQVRAALGDDGV